MDRNIHFFHFKQYNNSGDSLYYDKITDLIGNTPLIKIPKEIFETKSTIYLKYEKNNLSSSIKDRYAKAYIEKYIKYKPQKKLIIPTSGNLGISFASIATIYNIQCIIVLPENATKERKRIIKCLGANLIETPANEGITGSINTAKRLAKQNDYIYVDQFNDYLNLKIHQETTAKEIEEDLKDVPDYIFAGIGSSGTIMGIAKYFQDKKTKIMGVLPKENNYIPGIGPGFLPPICNLNNISEIVEISEKDLNKYIPYIIKKTGLMIGISGCAALLASIKIAKKEENKKIVVIIPDSYERYLDNE